MNKKNKICTVFLFVIIFFIGGCAQFTSIFEGQAQVSPQSKTTESQQIVTPVVLATGDRLPIVTKQGVYYFVRQGDTLEQIAKTYSIDIEDLAQINNLFDTDLAVGRRLFIPQKRYMFKYLSVTRIIKDKKLARDKTNKPITFVWPVQKFSVTSQFGMRRGRPHDGVDLAAPVGTPIYAAAEGKVIYEKRFAGYGNLIVIKHANNYFTAYSHLHSMKTKLNATVKQGQQIGTVGRTGRATGPHLHYEIHKGVEALDPMKIMPVLEQKKK